MGTLTAGSTYSAPPPVAIQVFPFKTFGEVAHLFFNYGRRPILPLWLSPGAFAVNWTWDAVPALKVTGLLRDVGGFGFFEGH